MKPTEIGVRYDRIARRWQENTHESYGMTQLEKAISFVKNKGRALDVGCGSTGRFVGRMEQGGFAADGVDVSAEMIVLARERNPGAFFFVADICEWELPHAYDLISAWDSIFHLPLESHEPVIRKLCAGLSPGGVLIFTCGGGGPGEIAGSFWGEDFEYSTLGIEGFVQLLKDCGCACRHVEYDQRPENHVYIIAQKPDGAASDHSHI